MEDGFIPVDEAIRTAPASTPTPITARIRGRPLGRSRGSRGWAVVLRGGESRVQKGFQSQPAADAVEGIEVKAVLFAGTSGTLEILFRTL